MIKRIKKITIQQRITGVDAIEEHDITSSVRPTRDQEDNTDVQTFNEIMTKNLGVLLIQTAGHGAAIIGISIEIE